MYNLTGTAVGFRLFVNLFTICTSCRLANPQQLEFSGVWA